MKKIVLALAVVFSVALVSCGNKAASDKDTANDTTTNTEVTVPETTQDTPDSPNGTEGVEVQEEVVATQEAPAENK